MTDRWLHEWFPVVAMLLQATFWGMAMPRIASRRMMALLAFQRLPEDSDW